MCLFGMFVLPTELRKLRIGRCIYLLFRLSQIFLTLIGGVALYQMITIRRRGTANRSNCRRRVADGGMSLGRSRGPLGLRVGDAALARLSPLP